jgi:hypothetical protein
MINKKLSNVYRVDMYVEEDFAGLSSVDNGLFLDEQHMDMLCL